ncbi:hypothetical protein ACFLU9_01080 [Chloroflexota bacterium]
MLCSVTSGYNPKLRNQNSIYSPGGIASSLLIPVLGVNGAVFWAASVLIDGDRYLDYLYRNRFKEFSMRRMFTFHKLLFEKEENQNFLGLSVMHTVEFFLGVYAVSALTGWVWLKAALWGMLFYMAVDLVYLYRQGRLFERALSIIEYVIRWKRMRRRGLHPEQPYQSTLQAMFVLSDPPEDKDGQANQQD